MLRTGVALASTCAVALALVPVALHPVRRHAAPWRRHCPSGGATLLRAMPDAVEAVAAHDAKERGGGAPAEGGTSVAPAAPPFVQGCLRPFAMRLHTREQAPKEGKAAPAKDAPSARSAAKAVSAAGYVKFLVDSQAVYVAFEEALDASDALRSMAPPPQLSRVAALDASIERLSALCLDGAAPPPVGARGAAYVQLLEGLAASSPPRFACHLYNFWFAHWAGGAAIGARVGKELFPEGEPPLPFYAVDEQRRPRKDLLDDFRRSIDAAAETWTPQERADCLDESANTFKYGGGLLGYLRE